MWGLVLCFVTSFGVGVRDGNGLQDAACAVRFLDLSGLCPGARNVVRFGMVCFPPSEVLA